MIMIATSLLVSFELVTIFKINEKICITIIYKLYPDKFKEQKNRDGVRPSLIKIENIVY